MKLFLMLTNKPNWSILKLMKPLIKSIDLTNTSRSLDYRGYPEGSLPDIIYKYKTSFFWIDLTERTKRDYNSYIKLAQEWSVQNRNPLIQNITPRDIIGFFSYFDKTPVRQKRAKALMSRLWTVAIQYGFIDRNLVSEVKLRRRQTKRRSLVIWQDADVAKFVEMADKKGRHSMGTAVHLAYNTAQRQGDILGLRQPHDYYDGCMNVLQSKTGKRVRIPVTESLRVRLDGVLASQELLVLNERTGLPLSLIHI